MLCSFPQEHCFTLLNVGVYSISFSVGKYMCLISLLIVKAFNHLGRGGVSEMCPDFLKGAVTLHVFRAVEMIAPT